MSGRSVVVDGAVACAAGRGHGGAVACAVGHGHGGAVVCASEPGGSSW
jgi:hypothetical protein